MRDDALLDALGGSNKIYNNQVEIEALLKAGVELPRPSQMLMTRAAKADVSGIMEAARQLRAEGKTEEAAAMVKKAELLKKSGDKIVIAVIGKPFSPLEVAKLKLWGSLDNIRQIYTPPVQIKGVKIATKYDELNDIRKEAAELLVKADNLKTAGKLDEAQAIERQANELIERASRMAREYSASLTTFGGMARLLYANTRQDTPIYKIARISRDAHQQTRRGIIERRYPEIDLSRISIRDLSRLARHLPKRALSARNRADALRREANRLRMEAKRLRRQDPARARDLRTKARRTIVEARRLAQIERSRLSAKRTTTTTARLDIPRTRITTKIRTKQHTIKEPPPETVVIAGRAKEIEEWTPEEIRSAIAWKQGVIVHAIKAPYKSDLDVTSFHKSRLPKGLRILKHYTGKDSPIRSARTLIGKPPSINVDMGKTDVIIRPGKQKRVRLSFRPDPKRQTHGDLSVRKMRSISKRRGRIHRTKIGSGSVLSRSPLVGI